MDEYYGTHWVHSNQKYDLRNDNSKTWKMIRCKWKFAPLYELDKVRKPENHKMDDSACTAATVFNFHSSIQYNGMD